MALLVQRLLFYFIKYQGPADLMTTRWLHPILDVGQVSGLVGGIVVGLVWLYRAWSKLPPEHRKSWNGRDVDPSSAAIRILFPVYNLYWIFVANVGLAMAIERHRQSIGRPLTKPLTNFAIACCIVQLIPLANLVVSPFLWAVLMARVDAAQTAAETR